MYTNTIVSACLDSNGLNVCFKTKSEILQHANPYKIAFPVATSAVSESVLFSSLFELFDPVQISFYILSERGTDKKSRYTRALRVLSSEKGGMRWRSGGDVRWQTRLRIVYRIVSTAWRRYISVHARNNNCCYIVEVSVGQIPRRKLKEHSGLNTSPGMWGERQTARPYPTVNARVGHTARGERMVEVRWRGKKPRSKPLERILRSYPFANF